MKLKEVGTCKIIFTDSVLLNTVNTAKAIA